MSKRSIFFPFSLLSIPTLSLCIIHKFVLFWPLSWLLGSWASDSDPILNTHALFQLLHLPAF